MTGWHDNYGIVGDVKGVENLAVGEGAKIEVTKIEQPVMEKLLALTSAVEAFDGPASTRAELLAANGEVADELNAPKPDKSRVLARLSEMAGVAGSATTIAGAVTALASVVELAL